MATDHSSSFRILYPHWRKEYAAALVELDRKKLPERVVAVEATIYARFQQISQNSPHDAKRRTIVDALQLFGVRKRDELGFPDWEKK